MNLIGVFPKWNRNSPNSVKTFRENSIVLWSIVVLMDRWVIYLTVCTRSDQYNYIACNVLGYYEPLSSSLGRLN